MSDFFNITPVSICFLMMNFLQIISLFVHLQKPQKQQPQPFSYGTNKKRKSVPSIDEAQTLKEFACRNKELENYMLEVMDRDDSKCNMKSTVTRNKLHSDIHCQPTMSLSKNTASPKPPFRLSILSSFESSNLSKLAPQTTRPFFVAKKSQNE